MQYNVYIRHNDGSMQAFQGLTEKQAKDLKKHYRRSFMAGLIDALEVTNSNREVVYSIQVARK